MITVDIVSPVGGRGGGIENVILAWTKNIAHSQINLRVFHLHSGMAYLNGYPKAYCINVPFEVANLQHCIDGYKLFINECGAPDICIATNWPMMSLACDIVRKDLHLDMHIISWVHNIVEEYHKEGLGGIDELLYADSHFAISKDIETAIKTSKNDAVVYLIANPINMQSYENYSPNPFTLAYVGRISYIKRIDIILEALYKSKHPWKLNIIGDGEIKDEVISWINLLKLSNQVNLLGWKENPWNYCNDASILLMASDYEGFGMTAFEASSLGMTVISTPVAGIKDYIINANNGYLFQFEDADMLARILDDIGDGLLPICDPQACRESALVYSTENYFKKINELLLQI